MFIASYLLLHRGRNSGRHVGEVAVARFPVIRPTPPNTFTYAYIRVPRRCVRVRGCVSRWRNVGVHAGTFSVRTALNSCSAETNYNEARLVGRESAMFSFLPSLPPPLPDRESLVQSCLSVLFFFSFFLFECELGVLLKGHVPPRMKFRPWIEKGETQHVSLVGLVVDDFERLDFDGMVRIEGEGRGGSIGF